jgi:TatD DNase family protein
MPLESIVIETDAPYLSPEPLRGQNNYPKNITYTLKKIAEIKKTDLKELARQIFYNTLRILELKE